MEIFQVPRRQVHARILLDDGRTLDSTLFLAVGAQGTRPETVSDRLNDGSEEFLPVACGQDRFLLNKSGIITVQVLEDDRDEGEEVPAREAVVRMSLAGGMGLLGRLRIVMPAERSRVLDYLNAAPRFLPLVVDGTTTLVHRRFIVSVRSEVEGS